MAAQICVKIRSWLSFKKFPSGLFSIFPLSHLWNSHYCYLIFHCRLVLPVSVMVLRLSCSVACGILPDQESNPCPLYLQMNSYPLHHHGSPLILFCLFVCFFHFISWRLITSQHFSGFRHTLTWISHGVTYISHPDPPSHLPLHPIPLGLHRAPGLSTCLMHPTWAGDLFHYR